MNEFEGIKIEQFWKIMRKFIHEEMAKTESVILLKAEEELKKLQNE